MSIIANRSQENKRKLVSVSPNGESSKRAKKNNKIVEKLFAEVAELKSIRACMKQIVLQLQVEFLILQVKELQSAVASAAQRVQILEAEGHKEKLRREACAAAWVANVSMDSQFEIDLMPIEGVERLFENCYK